MPMIERDVVLALAKRIREAAKSPDGLVDWSIEVAERMFGNRTPTDAICSRCPPQKGKMWERRPTVYCCTTTTDAAHVTTVTYFCAHVCSEHGLIECVEEAFFLGPDHSQVPHCLSCSGIVEVYGKAA